MLKRYSGNKKIGWVAAVVSAALTLASSVAKKISEEQNKRKAKRAYEKAEREQLELLLKNNNINIKKYDLTKSYVPRFVESVNSLVSQELTDNDKFTEYERAIYSKLAQYGKKTAGWYSPIFIRLDLKWDRTGTAARDAINIIDSAAGGGVYAKNIWSAINKDGSQSYSDKQRKYRYIYYVDSPLNFGVIDTGDTVLFSADDITGDLHKKFEMWVDTSGGVVFVIPQYIPLLNTWATIAGQIITAGGSMNDILNKIGAEASSRIKIYPADEKYIKGLFNIFVDIIKGRIDIKEKQVTTADGESYTDISFVYPNSVDKATAVSWAYDWYNALVDRANSGVTSSSLDTIVGQAAATDEIPLMVREFLKDLHNGVKIENVNDDYVAFLQSAQELKNNGESDVKVTVAIKQSKDAGDIDPIKGRSSNRELLFTDKQETAGFGTYSIMAAVLLGCGYLLNK